jgi:hypothetical protein
VTPILVIVENGSSVPLRLRYSQFALDAPSGRRFVARALSDLIPAASVGVRFGVVGGSPRSRFPWDPFADDPFSYDPSIRRQVALPTADMVQNALPETLVEPAARVRGFLYFEKVRGAERVTLHGDLVNARTGEIFGVVSIPFIVK